MLQAICKRHPNLGRVKFGGNLFLLFGVLETRVNLWRFLTSDGSLAYILTLHVTAWERVQSGAGHILNRPGTSWELLGELLAVLSNVLGSLKCFLEGLKDDDLVILRQCFETMIILLLREL